MNRVLPLGDRATAPRGMLPVEEAMGRESVRGVQVQVALALGLSAVPVFHNPPLEDAR